MKRNRAGAAGVAARPLMMALEPRIMFDAGGAASAAEGAIAADAQDSAHADAAHAATRGEGKALVAALADFTPPAAGRPPAAGHEIVFIAPDVPNARALMAGIADGAEVVVLDAGHDAIAQITAALAGRSGISAVHIISHGAAGELELGGATLSLDSMDSYSADIGRWAQSLTAQADILIYGCDVAAGARGQAFIGRLAALTGADVAASTDRTGDAGQGGDWQLEAATGAIEARLAVNRATRETWTGVLAQPAAGFGKALAFDGTNDYVDVGNSIQNLTAMTTEAWIYLKSVPTVGYYEITTNPNPRRMLPAW